MAYIHISLYLQISYSQFNFRTHTKDTLEKMESVGSYPPRFVVTYCTKNVPYEPLSSKITVSTGEEWGATFQVNDISDILQGKYVLETKFIYQYILTKSGIPEPLQDQSISVNFLNH